MAIQIHEKKLQRQLEGADKWRKAKDLGLSHTNGWGTFWWETGVGKTYAGYLICNLMLQRNVGSTFIIGSPSPTIKKQWEDALLIYVKPEYHANFRFYTSHQLIEIKKNVQSLACSLFIVDELHEWYTDERFALFDGSTINTKFCLGLTADYLDMQKRHTRMEAILPVIDRIDTEEALREGYISKYIEYNVGVELNEIENAQYKSLSDTISKNLSKFGKGGLELASKVLSGATNADGQEVKGIAIATAYAKSQGWRQGMNLTNPTEYEIHNMWNPSIVMGYASNALNSIRERKTLIYHAMSKIRSARDIVIKFNDLKTICFSQSTRFADALAKVINDNYATDNSRKCFVFHSQIETQISTNQITGKSKKKGKTVLKREAIETFRASKNDILSTASSLDRGLDVKDIRLALTTSGTQNPTQYNQRRGRAVRVEDDNEDIIVLVINLYVKNTIDEKWLRTRQAKSKNVVYWVDSIDDINYTPKNNEVFNLNEM